MTEEENAATGPEQAEVSASGLGKFQSVDALMRAYRELEAEFTRRSQRLRALEARAPQAADGEAAQEGKAPPAQKAGEVQDLLSAVRGNEEVRTRIVGEYLASLGGVPLMAGTGAGVTAPAQRAQTLKQAGTMALGYLRHRKQGE